jgi:hypothetical protein
MQTFLHAANFSAVNLPPQWKVIYSKFLVVLLHCQSSLFLFILSDPGVLWHCHKLFVYLYSGLSLIRLILSQGIMSSVDSEIIQTNQVFPKSDQDLRSPADEINQVESAQETNVNRNFTRSLLGYVKTKQFWILLIFGQVHHGYQLMNS